jgi:hypothetical protein
VAFGCCELDRQHHFMLQGCFPCKDGELKCGEPGSYHSNHHSIVAVVQLILQQLPQYQANTVKLECMLGRIPGMWNANYVECKLCGI